MTALRVKNIANQTISLPDFVYYDTASNMLPLHTSEIREPSMRALEPRDRGSSFSESTLSVDNSLHIPVPLPDLTTTANAVGPDVTQCAGSSRPGVSEVVSKLVATTSEEYERYDRRVTT